MTIAGSGRIKWKLHGASESKRAANPTEKAALSPENGLPRCLGPTNRDRRLILFDGSPEMDAIKFVDGTQGQTSRLDCNPGRGGNRVVLK